MAKTKITVLGAGAWGQAITSLLCEVNNFTNNYNITLWCHETNAIASLDGYANLQITQDLASALENCDFLFIAIPVKYLREILTQVKTVVALNANSQISIETIPAKIILLSKGIEQNSLLFSSEIAQEILGLETKVAVLSGPSFAHDLIAKQPTAVIVASENLTLAQEIKNIFMPQINYFLNLPDPQKTEISTTTTSTRNNLYFHVQISPDILGVQICAAYKNILALGAGILSGAGYRDNTRAYFLTMGLQELSYLVGVSGSLEVASTVYGLAGVGDLILTACSDKSRNFQVGAKLGAGIKLAEIMHTPELANCEALNTLQSINLLAQKLNLNLPIAQAIDQVVYAGAPVDKILMALKLQPL
jgi:glycerol-3-phosphate dehydrogenase (NAD(P)+)